MKKLSALLLTVCLVFILSCCDRNIENTSSTETSSEPTETELLLSSMTLEEKVWQLFFVRCEERGEYPVGGVVLFAKDIKNPTCLKSLTREITASNPKTAPLIAIDEEGGRVARIAQNPNFNVPKYQSMLSIGQTGNTENAFEVGENIGKYLKEYGIDINFAPVADVFTNSENTVIGDRAFSRDPETAAKMVAAAINGFHSEGIKTAAKHFPGHGNTKTDSHLGLAYSNKSWEELKNCELIPFSSAISAKTDLIMTAHISLPNIIGDNTPASLSYKILTKKLRGEMGYNGVIVTDALDMGAITEYYSDGTAAVKAFLAGADILLMPEDLEESYNAVLSAVKNGEITEERLNQSVERILKLKK